MIVSDIITEAFREGNLKPIGSTPTSAEAAEALSRLNRFVRALYGHAFGENLSDWPVPPRRNAPVAANYPLLPGSTDLPSSVYLYPPGNVRIVNSVTAATTIYLPQHPNDGARFGYTDVGATAVLTIDANARLIEGAASIPAPSEVREWVYRADNGNWQRIAALVTSDSSPFPDEFDDLLVCGLSIALSPRFGQKPNEITLLAYQTMRNKLKARYYQPTPQIGGGEDLPNGAQSYSDTYNLLGT